MWPGQFIGLMRERLLALVSPGMKNMFSLYFSQ